MKRILAAALTLFTLFISYVIIGGFIQKQQSSGTPVATTATSTAATDTFTLDEVAKHNTTGDCWLIIDNKIYSVGVYLAEHPGGASVITPYCGKEATQAFETQDRGSRTGRHSSQATAMLKDYWIGTVK